MLNATPIAALLTPVLLYAGAAAASVPLLIHLFSKRRFQRVQWAAIEFLQEAERRNRRRLRIEELLLLALRCLAMFLIGLMLARWFIRPEALAAVLGSPARTERIILIDDSFSMGLRDGGEIARDPVGQGRAQLRRTQPASGAGAGTVFTRATRSATRLVQWLRQEAPNDSLTILLTSRPDRPFRLDAVIADADVSAIEAELDALQPSSRSGNLPGAFEAVRDLLENRRDASNATVYVCSDFQQLDWLRTGAVGGAGSEGQPRRSPTAPLASWMRDDRVLRLVLMDVGAAAPQNRAIVAIEPQHPQVVAGVSGEFAARIANFGNEESPPGTLQVYLGDAVQPPAAVPAIPAGETVDVPLEVTFPGEGSESLTLQLESDALPVDNERSYAVPVSRAIRILIVNGEPSPDRYQDEAFLLSVALRPEGPQFSGNDVTIVDENEFEATDLASYQVVILANVYRISEDAADRLEAFAASGGGVQIFLGDQVDTDVYNRILYREGKGLLPARLGDVVTARDPQGLPLGSPDLSHASMRRFRDTQVQYFQGITATHFVRCTPAARPAQTQTAPANGAATRPQEVPTGATSVLLRLEDDEGSPALLERPFGDGHVVLSTLTADKEWTNLPDRPVFVVLQMELAQYLAKPPGRGGELLVGSPIRMPLDPGRFQPGATLTLPTFPDEPAVRLEAQPDSAGGEPLITWRRTDVPGIYRLELLETSGGLVTRQVAVNVDPHESDVRRADRSALLESIPEIPVTYVDGRDLVREQETQARRELWPSVLVLLVVVLLAEQSLAWWFGSGRRLDFLRRQVQP